MVDARLWGNRAREDYLPRALRSPFLLALIVSTLHAPPPRRRVPCSPTRYPLSNMTPTMPPHKHAVNNAPPTNITPTAVDSKPDVTPVSSPQVKRASPIGRQSPQTPETPITPKKVKTEISGDIGTWTPEKPAGVAENIIRAGYTSADIDAPSVKVSFVVHVIGLDYQTRLMPGRAEQDAAAQPAITGKKQPQVDPPEVELYGARAQSVVGGDCRRSRVSLPQRRRTWHQAGSKELEVFVRGAFGSSRVLVISCR